MNGINKFHVIQFIYNDLISIKNILIFFATNYMTEISIGDFLFYDLRHFVRVVKLK